MKPNINVLRAPQRLENVGLSRESERIISWIWIGDQKPEATFKTPFGVITPFFGVNNATFLRTNLSVEINAKKRLLL